VVRQAHHERLNASLNFYDYQKLQHCEKEKNIHTFFQFRWKNIMSAEIISVTDGIMTIKVMGLFTYPEQIALQKASIDNIPKQGKISILYLLEDFQGWSKDDNWEDVSFQEKSDPYIQKMAIVGEEKWQDLALMSVGFGFRSFPIEYFQADELEQAKAWLMVE
jgi:hypothetical protein